jgi:V8-like Glu-specific endopeptidase
MLRLSLGLAFLAASAAAQVAPIYTEVRKLTLDSGYVDNSSSQELVVFSKVLEAEKVDWIRLYFRDCNLPEGSRIRLTSLLDKAEQDHDGRSLRDYGDSSCYFNGGRIKVELLAGPGTKANRVHVAHAEVGPTVQLHAPNSICGSTDDRAFSTDPRVGRLSNGCTGWLINKRVAVTAGHCQSSSGSTIVSFNVPKSTSNGTYVQSHPNDQYPNVTSSIRRVSGGVGNDYAVMLLNRNSNTNLYPGEAQKQWFQLGQVPNSPSNQNIRITGYGTTSPRNERNGAQKTHVGPMYAVSSTALRYRTDTTGGNSGSPIIHENTGRAIGVHTHGGCRSSGTTSSNSGTSINVFRSVADQLLGSSGVGLVQTFGSGCGGSAGTPSLGASGVADIGQDLTFTVRNVPSLALGLLFVGTSNTSQGTIKLPRDLGGIGMTGCSQLVSLDAVLPMSTGTGSGTLSTRIPFNFSLLGIKGYAQHAVEDQKANALGVVVSNGLLIEVGK